MLHISDHLFAQFRVEVLLESAKSDMQQNNYVAAIKKLNLCIDTEPYHVIPFFYRGLSKYSLYDNKGAEEDFTSALSIYSPYFYEAYRYRSQIRYRLGDYAGALADINKVIDKFNKNNKLFIERAFIKLAAKDFTSAIADCNKVLQWNFLSEDAFLCKAAAEDALANYKEALCDYDQAIVINPLNENAYVRRGITQYNLENYNAAIKDYNLAIDIDSACTYAYYNRAEAEIKLNDNISALRDYEMVLFYEPQNAFAYFNRAVVYSNMTQYHKAIENFDKVLQINPDNVQALFNRAKLKQKKMDFTGAISDYSRIIKLYPYFIEAYYNRAQIKMSIKDLAGAKADMATGQMMSDVFHSKNSSQLSRDSSLIANLLRLSASFIQTPKLATDTLHIQFQPFFFIAKKNTIENIHYVNSPLLHNINAQSNKIFIFTNSDLITIDTLFNPIQNTKPIWEDIILETNNFYLNSAAEKINLVVQRDSLNPLAYFQRGMITCREIELLSKFTESSTIGNSSFDKEINTTKEKWISVLNDFSKAVQLQPSFAIAFFNRANVKCILHDFDGALKDYETAIGIKPDLAEAHFNSGYVLYYQNQKDLACSEFSKAGELGIPAAYTFIKKYCFAISR